MTASHHREWSHCGQHGSFYPRKLDSLPGSVLLAGLLPAAGWLGSRDSNGSSGGGGRGGRVCVCEGERRESPERSRKPLGVRYPGDRAARQQGSRGGGGERPEGAVQSWDGRARGCARGGRAAARWAVGDPIVGRRLPRVNAPLWAGGSCGAGQPMPRSGRNDPGSEPKFPLWRMGDGGGHPLESGSRVEVGVPRA